MGLLIKLQIEESNNEQIKVKFQFNLLSVHVHVPHRLKPTFQTKPPVMSHFLKKNNPFKNFTIAAPNVLLVAAQFMTLTFLEIDKQSHGLSALEILIVLHLPQQSVPSCHGILDCQISIFFFSIPRIFVHTGQ